MTDKSAAICVAGWHYNREFYDQVRTLPAEVFVVSHRLQTETPSFVVEKVAPDRVFFDPNTGYDWGCYQQFLEKRIWRGFEYLFFIHDDAIIKDNSLVEDCIRMLNQYTVVGNGRVTNRRNHPDRVPGSYAYASWKPPSREFQHDLVRGSFFATTRDALEQLERFEVFWDPLHLSSHYGNWSTRATCAKLQYLFGENTFGFLSETYCESDYLIELVRGGIDQHNPRSPLKKWAISAIGHVCRMYMSIYWSNKRGSLLPTGLLRVIAHFVSFVSGSRNIASDSP